MGYLECRCSFKTFTLTIFSLNLPQCCSDRLRALIFCGSEPLSLPTPRLHQKTHKLFQISSKSDHGVLSVAYTPTHRHHFRNHLFFWVQGDTKQIFPLKLQNVYQNNTFSKYYVLE